LFVDLRGFTAQSEEITPAAASEELRRFYAFAEKVLFPEALIDKLIGDEVMALYLPVFIRPGSLEISDDDRRHVAALMVQHAHRLLHELGYGTPAGPAFQVGIGIDFGEAFVGNIGSAAVNDFTAVGDVVNTASRLQDAAASGDVVLSARVARLLDEPIGSAEQIVLKGKQEPVEVRRVQWPAESH
jgi:adenylate cyclase